MNKGNPFYEYIENELNADVLDELAVEHMRRWQEAMDELLKCLEELKYLLSSHSSCGRILPKDRRD